MTASPTILTSAERNLLARSRLILVGYGAQGEAEASNLKRSEIPFELALRRSSPSTEKAKNAGHTVVALEEVDPRGRIMVMNLPDDQQGDIYRRYRFEEASHLIFAHGFNTTFGLIPVVKSGPLHCLVAPKGAAAGLKEFYATNDALPAILATNGPAKDTDKILLETYARAIGCHAQSLVWARFEDETVCDLFSEQTLLCGGVSSLVRQAFEVLVEGGYKPETAYFETLFELKLIVDLMWKQGITGMRQKISPTARYGDITRGDRVIDASVKERMRTILREIEQGDFAKEFLSQNQSEAYQQQSQKQAAHLIETIGLELRKKRLGS